MELRAHQDKIARRVMSSVRLFLVVACEFPLMPALLSTKQDQGHVEICLYSVSARCPRTSQYLSDHPSQYLYPLASASEGESKAHRCSIFDDET